MNYRLKLIWRCIHNSCWPNEYWWNINELSYYLNFLIVFLFDNLCHIQYLIYIALLMNWKSKQMFVFVCIEWLKCLLSVLTRYILVWREANVFIKMKIISFPFVYFSFAIYYELVNITILLRDFTNCKFCNCNINYDLVNSKIVKLSL